MEDIRIYDFEFNLLHIEHNIISSNWTIYYNNIGTWEGHFNLNSSIVPIVMKYPYLVAVQGDKQAIITGRQANAEFVLYGRTVNWILSRRVIPKFRTFDLAIAKDVESVARWVIEQAFADVENFVLCDPVGFSTEKDFWRNTTNPVSEVISDCLANDNAGHQVVFDTASKQWVFQVLKGQSVPIVVSEANRNAYETEYTEDMQDFFTGGWYELQQEAEEEEQPDPVWTYVASDNPKSGIYKWDAVLAGSVESEAKSELRKKRWEKTIKAKLRNMRYGVDYQLGDVLRIQKQAGDWQATFEHRVSGVNVWYENNDIGEQPIFEEG